MLKDGCEAGCNHFTGGEIKHHKDCQFYKDSLSEELDNLRQQINLSLGDINKCATNDCNNVINNSRYCKQCNKLWES